MRVASHFAGTLLLACSFAFVPLAFSAETPKYDEATLTILYDAYLKKDSNDTYLAKRISDERAKVKALAEKEVSTLSVSPQEKLENETANVIDQQRALVGQITQKIRALKIDSDLLGEEEKKYYAETASKPAPTDVLLLTKSHAELLAKKAILDERISAFNAGLSLQEDRLQKLNWQQWLEQFQALFGILYYLAIVLGAVVLDRIVRRRLAGKIEAHGKRYLLGKIFSAGIYTVATLWLLSKLTTDYPSALASLAIVGAGIAVALQDVVKDIMGWILILHRRLYKLGHRVSIGTHTGDVIDIGPFRTMMLEISSGGAFNAHERTGKILYIPNSLILREPILNYNTTSDFMSVEKQLTITYGSNWQKAKKILEECLAKEVHEYVEQARAQQRRRTALFYTMWEVSEPEVHTDIADSGVLFTLKFTVPIGKRRKVMTNLAHAILEGFGAESDVTLAYNTMQVEGVGKN